MGFKRLERFVINSEFGYIERLAGSQIHYTDDWKKAREFVVFEIAQDLADDLTMKTCYTHYVVSLVVKADIITRG